MRFLISLPLIALATACASAPVETAPVVVQDPPLAEQIEPSAYDLAMDTVDKLLEAGNEQAAILRLEQLIGMQAASEDERASALYRMAELKMGEGNQVRGAISALDEFLTVYPEHEKAEAAAQLKAYATTEADMLQEQLDLGGQSPMDRFKTLFRLGDHQTAADLMFTNALQPENTYLLDMYQIGYLCDAAELTGPSYDITEPDGTDRAVRFCDFGK